MVKLSIVIVNYNVEHFLKQCLYSVFRAITNIHAEVFVVDNNSVDNSLEMLANDFPQVTVIANKENVGFSKANNQAAKVAQGEYILLLNPDTLVEEDTFEKLIEFMESTADAGAVGVKMINGKGEFLPESKRGLPIPKVAFYKIFGFNKFFPKSKKFGFYYLSYLNNEELHAVDVLSGAFMLIRKKVYDDVGGLDEKYFMYGEDIDLSYKITKAGYKNYYYPFTRIIHYKGESTKKGSMNYVFIFYRAMQIFVKKHLSFHNAKLFHWILNFAIWFRASMAMIKRIFSTFFLPVLDFIMIYAGMFAIAQYWQYHVLIDRGSSFPKEFFSVVIPLYIIILIIGMALSKGYRKLMKLNQTNRGFILGTLLVLLIYALLPETFRYSRAVVVFGAMWGIIAVNANRYLLHRVKKSGFHFEGNKKRRVAIIGEENRAMALLKHLQLTYKELDFVRIITLQNEKKILLNTAIIGDVSQLKELITIYNIEELLFCADNLTTKKIIDYMEQLRTISLEYKIAPPNSQAIIGSNSILLPENITKPRNLIFLKQNRTKKRIFDIISSLFFLFTALLTIWFIPNKKQFLKNLFLILIGKNTWIGVPADQYSDIHTTHTFPPYIFQPFHTLPFQTLTTDLKQKTNHYYLTNYKVKNDITILLKSLKKVGTKPRI